MLRAAELHAKARLHGVAPHYLRMPRVEAGLRVGLFGGSFNPPHAGHRLVAETALKALRLDQIWWIVTPGNPLKTTQSLMPLAQRITLCEVLAADPRMHITAFEAGHDMRYTADMIERMLARRPQGRFVWVMGADNLRDFHLWRRWRSIVEAVPIAIVDRPGATLSALSSTMARSFASARLNERDAKRLAFMPAPAWTFIHGPRSSLSSTALRASCAG